MAKRQKTKKSAVPDPEWPGGEPRGFLGNDPPEVEDDDGPEDEGAVQETPPPMVTEVPAGPHRKRTGVRSDGDSPLSPLRDKGKGVAAPPRYPWSSTRRPDDEEIPGLLEPRRREGNRRLRGGYSEDEDSPSEEIDLAEERGRKTLEKVSERYARRLQEQEYADEEFFFNKRDRREVPQESRAGPSAPKGREKSAERQANEPRENVELEEMKRKYAELLWEKDRERKTFFEDVLGGMDILTRHIESTMNSASNNIRQTVKIAQQSEAHMEGLQKIRRGIANAMGRQEGISKTSEI